MTYLPNQLNLTVLSLRAKVSHSWLDHEIRMIPVETAVRRWRDNEWESIAERWRTLRRIAQSLGSRLGEFRASVLIDSMPQFAGLSVQERSILRQRLDALQPQWVDVGALANEYSACLDALWSDAQVFFGAVARPGALEEGIAQAWRDVRHAGESFKSLFESGRVPGGIVLP